MTPTEHFQSNRAVCDGMSQLLFHKHIIQPKYRLGNITQDAGTLPRGMGDRYTAGVTGEK